MTSETSEIKTVLAEFRFPGGAVATVKAELPWDAEPGKVTFSGDTARLTEAGREVLEGVIGEHWVYAARRLAASLGAELDVEESGELAMVER